jgi:hypothetical protein
MCDHDGIVDHCANFRLYHLTQIMTTLDGPFTRNQQVERNEPMGAGSTRPNIMELNAKVAVLPQDLLDQLLFAVRQGRIQKT